MQNLPIIILGIYLPLSTAFKMLIKAARFTLALNNGRDVSDALSVDADAAFSALHFTDG